MGIHSGGCVAGVVGTKIPHYSVFGDTVEIVGLMESSGEPMKIQVHTLKPQWCWNITQNIHLCECVVYLYLSIMQVILICRYR